MKAALAFALAVSVAGVAHGTEAPNMPARNPWLTESVYPTSHFNGGATDSVVFAGPVKGQEAHSGKGRQGGFERNGVKPGSEEDWIGYRRVRKWIARYSQALADRRRARGSWVHSLPGFRGAGEEGNARGRCSGPEGCRRSSAHCANDAQLLTAIGGVDKMGVTFETGINGVYNLFDRDGFHYCVYGGTKVLKTTDDNVARGPVRVVKSVDVAAAIASGKRRRRSRAHHRPQHDV